MPAEQTPPSNLKSIGSYFFELVKLVVKMGIIVFVIRAFFIQPFIVHGNSMEPNFHESQYLIIEKLSYRFSGPDRGDVIVFKAPEDIREQRAPVRNFIKRIVGLPGEKVEVIASDTDCAVVIYNSANPNGMSLDEPYIPDELCTQPGPFNLVTLGKGDYFVLGDNRVPGQSSDSREWGTVHRSLIAGKAWLSLFPLETFGFIQHERYAT